MTANSPKASYRTRLTGPLRTCFLWSEEHEEPKEENHKEHKGHKEEDHEEHHQGQNRKSRTTKGTNNTNGTKRAPRTQALENVLEGAAWGRQRSGGGEGKFAQSC